MTKAYQKTAFLLLALLALGWAQVFGLSRGYVCDCGGAVEITMMDHCHGPHGSHCHTDTEPVHHHSEPDDTQDHKELKETVVAKQPTTAASFAVPMPVLAVLVVLPVLTLQDVVVEQMGTRPLPLDFHDPGGTWSHVLAHQISLRI